MFLPLQTMTGAGMFVNVLLCQYLVPLPNVAGPVDRERAVMV